MPAAAGGGPMLFASRSFRIAAVCAVHIATSTGAFAQEPFDRSRDRGEGLPLSMFGTYIRSGQLVVYPFYEYYRDHDFEYEAGELGFEGTTELRGGFHAHERLLFVAYGFSENIAAEFEIAGISASLDKSPLDDSALPPRLEQSGLGDVEGQLRWRWKKESDTRPELFSYFETVFPAQQSKLLIGTPDWELKFGFGLTRGLRWGTISARAAVGYADGAGELGEYAVEYLKRVSSRLRLFGAVEGSEDELELITEGQIFLTPRIVLKLNNSFGLTSKATDWAPEIGVMFFIR
jgi:hypothetical protein